MTMAATVRQQPKWIVTLLLLFLLPHHPPVTAFLGSTTTPHSALTEFSLADQVLQLRLDLGWTNNDPYTRTALPRLALQGPTLQLRPAAAAAPLPWLPAAHDPLYQTASTGPQTCQILHPASYVGWNGLERVPLERGCWEMIWVEGSFSGRLVCAFELPIPIHRNGVTFDAGPLHVTFHLYSPESWAAAQRFKELTQQKSAHLLREKEEELFKMQRASHWLAKAVHYQRAFAAFDKLLVLPVVSHIPNPDEVVELNNGLLLVKQGKVWKKTNALLGPSSRTLGTAVVHSVGSDNGEEEEDFDIRRHKRLLGRP
eukprot:CAMPEP_0168812436 /NCGR_PEP_ID=MMETSP0726-20121227/4639_1 /TAXON_ID=265536 /ORGANISM="Amphiprora sp., Strain CCMP467" /LENGTH=312 /DNA_ID=CAMNT_0008864529 /DNA_START=59 /DNA_END=997 /DNA_ORIENTATION=-